jgi:apolipoprotein N-acyltransferase
MSLWNNCIPPRLQMALYGMMLGLSAPGYGLWPLAWVALIPALVLCQQEPDAKARFWNGFCLGAAFGAMYYLWFFDLHPLAWLGFGDVASRLITLGGWLLLVMETALVSALLCLLYGQCKPGWPRAVLFPALWVFGFAALNLTPMALPWAQLEYTQARLWPMRLLVGAVSGSGVTALIVLHNSLWAQWLGSKLTRHGNQGTVQTLTAWQKALPVLAPVLVGLMSALPEPDLNPRPWPIPVAVIQGNLPIETIRSGALNPKTIEDSYIQPLAEVKWPPGTLLVYPEEGVAPGWTKTNAPYRNLNMFRLMALAQQRHLYIAVGVSSVDPEQRRYNSLALITPDETLTPEAVVQFYHKRRLVPFGEFTPYGLGELLTPLLNRWHIDYSTPYNAGLTSPLLQAGPVKLGSLICFELIDSAPGLGGFAQKYQQQGANLLINSSNLGWFHQNPLLEAQFIAIGQLRAAETHLPLVISSNTGISAIISNQGKLLQETHPNRQNQPKSQIIFYNGK